MTSLAEKEFASLHIAGRTPRRITLSNSSRISLQEHQEQLEQSITSSSELMFRPFRGKDHKLMAKTISRHGLKGLLYDFGKQVGYPASTQKNYAILLFPNSSK